MRVVVRGSGHVVEVAIVARIVTENVVQDLAPETGKGCFLLCIEQNFYIA